ncbi:hypothetical protein EMIHUDRAFT_68706, partial [Emiliania huxleyi CCMP1516]|uniref:Protein kinase domain-containing protein n=2 Tax=Emiliania huxleyi TaxID=2903 RepID=A0A0D3I586_EMIH1
MTLSRLIESSSAGPGAARENMMLSILRQVAEALEALHQHTPAIVHRDLKPSNILLKRDTSSEEVRYHVFLCDFGSAKAVKSDTADFSNLTGAAGTRVYQAPEIGSQARVTHKCDVYSFGVTAFQLFAGESGLDALDRRLKDTTPTSMLPCSDDARRLINRCMNRDRPDARPDFTEIKRSLRDM